jgi:hypothetical protein
MLCFSCKSSHLLPIIKAFRSFFCKRASFAASLENEYLCIFSKRGRLQKKTGRLKKNLALDFFKNGLFFSEGGVPVRK